MQDFTSHSMFGTPASFLDDDTATHDISTTNSLDSAYLELRQACINEIFSPELIPYEKSRDLIDTMQKRLEQHAAMSQVPEYSSIDETQQKIVCCHELDVERTRYLLRLYFRTRILKIEQYVMYYVGSDRLPLLSPAEQIYAKK